MNCGPVNTGPSSGSTPSPVMAGWVSGVVVVVIVIVLTVTAVVTVAVIIACRLQTKHQTPLEGVLGYIQFHAGPTYIIDMLADMLFLGAVYNSSCELMASPGEIRQSINQSINMLYCVHLYMQVPTCMTQCAQHQMNSGTVKVCILREQPMEN